MSTVCTAIYNARIVAGNQILDNHTLLFDHLIRAILPDKEWSCRSGAAIPVPGGNLIVDHCHNATQHFLSPGFIDLHIHGCAGSDTMDANEEALSRISQSLPQTGVTAFLPTTMTMDFPLVSAALVRIRRAMAISAGAQVLGCHMEGPFISASYKGAQDATFLREPNFPCIAEFQDVIKIITIAPEESGSLPFIRQCAAQGLVVSVGHSGASYEETQAALVAGAVHFTHTFNAATPFNHRAPGVTGAALDSTASCELIADNIHVHPAAQRILLQAKGRERVILVTDAMRACLMGDGDFDLGGQPVTVRAGQARLLSGALAGSVLTLNRAVQNFMTNTSISLPDAIGLVTANPAARLKLAQRKGHLAVGSDADLTIFNDQIDIWQTYIGGKLIYSN